MPKCTHFPYLGLFRKYRFDKSIFNGMDTGDYQVNYLYPHKGENLFHILETNYQIADLMDSVFARTGFRFVVDYDERRLKIARFGPGNTVVLLPFYMVAETIQRLLFNYAVIISNREAVIVMEEPEVHLFPFYIDALAFEILNSRSNQFLSPLIILIL